MRFSYAKNNAKKLLALPLSACIYGLSFLSRRNPNLWVFGRKGLFGDNVRYLMEYVNETRPWISCVWIANTTQKYTTVQAMGLRVVYKNSYQGWLCCARASIGFIGLGLSDLVRPLTGGMKVIQLWHGSPLKKIGLDSDATFSINVKYGKKILQFWLKFLYKQYACNYWLVTAPSELVKERYMSAFGIKSDRVVVTGDPKGDKILQLMQQTKKTNASHLALYYKIPKHSKIILYAPTWREMGGSALVPDEAELAALDAVLEKTNTYMLVRGHYAKQALNWPQTKIRIIEMQSNEFTDVNLILHELDLLISDYSGIIMDYSLTGNSIIFYAPDLESYTKERGFYEDYKLFTGGTWATSWNDVTTEIDRCLSSYDIMSGSQSARMWKRYVKYDDTESCARILREIEARL